MGGVIYNTPVVSKFLQRGTLFFRLLRNHSNTHPAPTGKLAFEGVEYLGDNVHNGWADIFERLAISSYEGYADLPLQHPNIDTLPDMDISLFGRYRYIRRGHHYRVSNKPQDLTVSCQNIAVQLSPPI